MLEMTCRECGMPGIVAKEGGSPIHKRLKVVDGPQRTEVIAIGFRHPFSLETGEEQPEQEEAEA